MSEELFNLIMQWFAKDIRVATEENRQRLLRYRDEFILLHYRPKENNI